MKKKTEIAIILDQELEKYEKDIGEPKYTISLCRNHHVDLMKESFPRSTYKGRSIIQLENSCLVCDAAPLTLVAAQKESK